MRKQTQIASRIWRSAMLLILTVLSTGAWAEDYNLWIGETQVTSANATGVTGDGIVGTVTFEVDNSGTTPTYNLYLTNATLTVPIKISYTQTNIYIKGDNSITTESGPAIQGVQITGLAQANLNVYVKDNATGTLHLKTTDGESSVAKGFGSFLQVNSITSILTTAPVKYDTSVDTFERSYKYSITNDPVEDMTFSTVGTYEVWVAGQQVTADNKDDVLDDGTVSFTQEEDESGADVNTLTLNGATIAGSISYSEGSLRINLIGENTVNAGNNSCIIATADSNEPTLTFLTSAEATGSLALTTNADAKGPLIYNVNSDIVYKNNLHTDNLLMDRGVHNATISVSLDAPQLYRNYSDDTGILTFGLEPGDNSEDTEYYYSIDYVSEDIEDVEDMLYEVDVVLQSPCTVTVYAKYGDYQSKSVTGKLFGFAEETITVVNDMTGKTVDLPEVVPSRGEYLTLGTATISTSDAAAAAYIGQEGEIVLSSTIESGTVTVTVPMSEVSGVPTLDFTILNRESASDASYPLQFTLVVNAPQTYGLTVNDIVVNDLNRKHILGEDDESVQFDGHNTLILDHATLTSVEITREFGNELHIFLKGDNTISNANDKAITGARDLEQTLFFQTMDNNPGKLTLEGSNVVSEFATVTYVQPLALLSTSPADYTLPSEDINITEAVIGAPLNLIVDNIDGTTQGTEATVSYASDAGTTQLTNVVIGNVLYTLNDTQTANADDDGIADGKLVLNSTVSESALEEAMALQPGSIEYAEAFKGLTFIVPAGTGEIELTGAYSLTGSRLCLKVGKQDPTVTELTETPANYTVPYACSEASYVRIYQPAVGTGARSFHDGLRPIGPKSTVSTGLGGLKVTGSSISAAASVSSEYLMMSADDMLQKWSGRGQGITVDDPKITALAEDLLTPFTTGSIPAPLHNGAPRRKTTMADNDIPFVDMRGTSIVGMEVSRSKGAFNGFPESTLIYMPAGNFTTEPNVIIGGVCDDLRLDGSVGNKQTFTVPSGATFTAAKARLERTFTEGVRSTVYLPFDIASPGNFGTFYAFNSVDTDNGTVSMSATDTPQANTPYIFEAKTGGVSEITVNIATVKPVTSDATTEFKGTYEKKTYDGSNDMYCFAGAAEGTVSIGQFVKMETGSYVPPFRAYFKATSGAPYFDIILGDDAVTTIETAVPLKPADTGAWYTLDGRRLSAAPQQKGIYIHNGKKHAVK